MDKSYAVEILENQIAIMCTLAAVNAAVVQDGTLTGTILFETMKELLNNRVGETRRFLDAE